MLLTLLTPKKRTIVENAESIGTIGVEVAAEKEDATAITVAAVVHVPTILTPTKKTIEGRAEDTVRGSIGAAAKQEDEVAAAVAAPIPILLTPIRKNIEKNPEDTGIIGIEVAVKRRDASAATVEVHAIILSGIINDTRQRLILTVPLLKPDAEQTMRSIRRLALKSNLTVIVSAILRNLVHCTRKRKVPINLR